MNYLSLLKNASIFGLMSLIVGVVVMYTLIQTPLTQDCPNKCNWNKYFIREISVFLTGFLSYIIFEVLREQKIYMPDDTK